MWTPHYNYYPPAGQVINTSNPSVTWDGRAWKLNGKVYGVPSAHKLIGRPGGALNGWIYDWQKHAWMEPAGTQSRTWNQPMPPRPAPVGQPQMPAPMPEKKEMIVEKKPDTVLDSLVKHPVAPVMGGVLLLASYLTEEPQPPTFPDGLPDATRAQWQMIFNQNQQKFQRRMDLYENLGMLLLGYSEARAVLEALPAKRTS